MRLKEHVVFITGASSGIGKATVRALLAEDARVFGVGRTPERVEETRREIADDRFAIHVADVAEEAAVREAFAVCSAKFGAPDILINNAGLGIPTPDLAEADPAAFDEMFRVNARGVFLCTREALKVMKPRRRGHIVNIISMAGQRANGVAPLYCASKFAARGFSMGLAEQALKAGIRVTDVNPGPVDTAYWGRRAVPREKMLKAEEVAEIIRFVLTLPERVVVREINFDALPWLAQ